MTRSEPSPLADQAAALLAATGADLQTALGRLGPAQLEAADRTWRRTCWPPGNAAASCWCAATAAAPRTASTSWPNWSGASWATAPAMRRVALTVNTSTLTAVGNDYGFDEVFARQVQALGSPHDVLLVLSTRGNSANCVRAVEQRAGTGLRASRLSRRDGGRLLPLVDGALVAPSDHTPAHPGDPHHHGPPAVPVARSGATARRDRSMLPAFLASLRPRQWTKNLLLFAGVIFAQKLGHDAPAWCARCSARVVFCLASGVIYVFNDIVDRELDRLPPAQEAATDRLGPAAGRLRGPRRAGPAGPGAGGVGAAGRAVPGSASIFFFAWNWLYTRCSSGCLCWT